MTVHGERRTAQVTYTPTAQVTYSPPRSRTLHPGQDITNKLFKLLADRDVDLPGKSHR